MLCILPSGYGKSMLYLIPSLMDEEGLTIVVEPLLSIVED
jgi:superfamily II DNA helicase RecQ